MARTRASLPDPSSVGFFVMLLAACALIAVNSVVTTAVYNAMQNGAPWLKNPRFGQPILFFAPLILLIVELWLASIVSRMLWRPRDSAS